MLHNRNPRILAWKAKFPFVYGQKTVPDLPLGAASAPSSLMKRAHASGSAARSFASLACRRVERELEAGARHVSWESCQQLAAHTRLGRSVGREDRLPQWGVVHEHTPVSIPVFMNTKKYEFEVSLTGLGRGRQATRTKATHANSHRWGIRPSLATALHKKESPQMVPKITIFLVFMNKTQILLFAL